MIKKFLTVVCLLVLASLAGPAAAAPIQDGGGFPPTSTPTPEPTFTPQPTETPTPTSTQQVLAVTIDLPIASDTPVGLGFDQPSNILAEPTSTAPATGGGNPLNLMLYMVLFIVLLAGIWMLFGRRSGQNQP